jgi:RNA recognition motif-containing protein
VSFIKSEDSMKALEAMHGGDLDGRQIRVEKARRNAGYVKTPGRCKQLTIYIKH